MLSVEATGSDNSHSGMIEAILVFQDIRGERLSLETKRPVAVTSNNLENMNSNCENMYHSENAYL